MQSKHAITAVLLLGAFALVFTLGALMFLELASVTSGNTITVLAVSENEERKNIKPPRVISKIEGSDAVIAEIDTEGNTLRVIYSSSLLDTNTDFSLFAIPQEHYTGIIYVQAVPDAARAILKVYPLDTETGKLAPSILNVEYDTYTISKNGETVTVIKGGQNSLYDLLTGRLISTTTIVTPTSL